VPAGQAMELSGSAATTGRRRWRRPAAGRVAYAVAGVTGPDWPGLEDFLFAVISGGRRMASWAAWLEFSAMRELALRHPAVRPAQPAPLTPSRPRTDPAPEQSRAPDPSAPARPSRSRSRRHRACGAAQPAAAAMTPGAFSEFVADELSLDLRMSWRRRRIGSPTR